MSINCGDYNERNMRYNNMAEHYSIKHGCVTPRVAKVFCTENALKLAFTPFKVPNPLLLEFCFNVDWIYPQDP